MGEHYSHWTLEERCRLRGLMEMGLGETEIARRLGRHRSTVHREIARNGRVDGGYTPEGASRKAWARKLRGSRILRSPSHPALGSCLGRSVRREAALRKRRTLARHGRRRSR